MDIQNLGQRREAPGAARNPTNDRPQKSGGQFAGALGQVDDQTKGTGADAPDSNANHQAAASVEAEPELSEQEKLRQERLERFGSYTAYSLWRKTPAMALGIVQPKSEEYFAQHGLLDYWRTEKAHWQGQVSAMSEAERAATGTRLLDEVQAEAAITGASDEGNSSPSEPEKTEAATDPVDRRALAPAQSQKIASEQESSVQPVELPTPATTVESAPDPIRTATVGIETPPPQQQATALAATAPEEPEQTTVATGAQPVEQPKTQEELRAERLERFGSYTAYSLWRKTPAMALGIVQPKSEDYFAEHGLLDYWRTEKAHWQGQVVAMSEAERAATGTSLLDEEPAVATIAEASSIEAAAVSDEPVASAPPTEAALGISQDAEQAAAQETIAAAALTGEPVDALQPDEPLAANSEVAATNSVEVSEPLAPVATEAQAVQQAKTQEELRAERLQRFGSYTAYSLWRKIPAMALGIVQPKSEDYFAEHGLLEYWHTERDHWQGKVAAMSDGERAATGTSLLETATDQAVQALAAAQAVSDPQAIPAESTGSINGTSEPVAEQPVVVGDPEVSTEIDPAPQPAVSVVQEIEEAKTQEELRQERLERFGSYTAYSLWRKIPAMALGIVQPKSEDYFAEHGLLEYWHTEKKHWQGQVAAMTEAERIATGTSLLDET